MANRQSTIALLIGLLVGVLLGAGVLHTAEVTADVLLARTSNIRVTTRTLQTGPVTAETSIIDNRTDARPSDSRNEGPLGTRSLTEAQLQAIYDSCPVENTQCFVNAIMEFVGHGAAR